MFSQVLSMWCGARNVPCQSRTQNRTGKCLPSSAATRDCPQNIPVHSARIVIKLHLDWFSSHTCAHNCTCMYECMSTCLVPESEIVRWENHDMYLLFLGSIFQLRPSIVWSECCCGLSARWSRQTDANRCSWRQQEQVTGSMMQRIRASVAANLAPEPLPT